MSKLENGQSVSVSSLGYAHAGSVVTDHGKAGLDGRRWVQVEVRYGKSEVWTAHFEREDLVINGD